MSMAIVQKDKPTPEDYEKLGRAIESALIDDYIDLLGNTRRQIKGAFVRGLFTGFGGVVGATVVVALVVWLLHLLGCGSHYRSRHHGRYNRVL
jgi:hypothetical protein